MNIRPRVLILLTVAFVTLSSIAILIQEFAVMPSFARLEESNARTAMHRTRHAVDRILDALEINAIDWADWNDVYQFVDDHNPAFIRTNITPSAINHLQIDAMLIVDRNANVVLSSGQYVPSGVSVRGVLESGNVLLPEFRWRNLLGTRRSAHGLVHTDLGVLLLAGAPILDGSGTGESHGMVILGRLLTPALLRRIETQTETKIDMVDDHVGAGDEQVVTSDALTQVYGSFNDVFGKPVMTLRADLPRDITAYGRRAILIAAGSLIVATALTFILLVALLNRYVLSPLTRLTRHAVAIGEDPDHAGRLELPTRDEFANLAQEFDGMVARLAATRRDLVDQSFQAGFAELAKGVLHNLGNALTPIGVTLARMAQRTRESPVADLELAVREMSASADDAARRAALLEFMALGCRELAQAGKENQADIDVLQRQASVMQATLGEQMRGSHQKAVVLETMTLPDLVAQSLDIVPGSARRRLDVQIDESLHKVGSVRLARTVLRMVLQNLIINAADAVRDGGRERGVLRFVAELVTDGGQGTLHLQCQDDGMGIAADKLETIFEKGYTTKPRDKNQGISLHWCANAILSLGGRIWATSDGPGRGASMHVQLPV